VNVSNEAQLQSAIRAAAPNTTIIIAPGTYHLTATLSLTGVNDVTLRGATDDRNDVVLVGRGMTNTDYGSVPSAIWTNGPRITIANLTIRDVYRHAIALDPGAASPHVHNVRLVDAGEQFIKANSDGTGVGVDSGVVELSLIEYTSIGRSDNVSGVDVAAGRNWVVRDSVFRNIAAPGGQLAGPAILFWQGSSKAIIDSNTFIDCQREIALGLEDRSASDNVGGIVRNNFISRGNGMFAGAAVSIANSPNTQVLHNTILVNGTYQSAIEYRFSGTIGTIIANNLTDADVWARDGAKGSASNNYLEATATMFVDVASGDLHLMPGATAVMGRVPTLPDALQDHDGETRPQGAAADYGADEYQSSTVPLALQKSRLSDGSGLVAAQASPGLPTGASSVSGATNWTSQDIGAPALAGSATFANGAFTVKGGGTDIWGTSDQFQFVYQPMTGDGQIVARITSLTMPNSSTKAGVMIRAGLTANAANAAVLVSAASGLTFQWRASTSGLSNSVPGPLPVGPTWLKVVRAGSALSGYSSNDGNTWTSVGTSTIPMGSTVYVGLAVTSHAASSLATATFTNVTGPTGGGAPPPPSNQPPAVSLTSPTASASFTAPATISFAASASDPDGTVARVEFFAGTSQPVGSDTSSPYTFSWTNVGAGTYTLTAVAYDNAGLSTTSAPVTVTVSGGGTGGSGLPSPWVKQDIGAPALTGSATFANSVFTVKGGGTDIWGTSDQFQFVYQPMTGDGQIVARVASLTTPNSWTKAGMMIRAALVADAANALVLVSAANGITFQWRASAGGSSNYVPGPSAVAPTWLKLVRAGSTLSGYSSNDGNTWTSVGTSTITMGSTVYVGLAVTSHTASSLATATFSNVTGPTSGGTPPPSGSVNKTLMFTPSVDDATNVTSYRIDVFGAGANPNTATPAAAQDVGKPPIVNGETSVNLAPIITPLSPGNYFVTVTAIGPGGSARSAPSGTFTR
jgi:regulation of enolase protein 1 (concanavalin A-like superfamily)